MSVSVGDTVILTAEPTGFLAELLDEKGLDVGAGDRLTVQATADGLRSGNEEIHPRMSPIAYMFAPEGAIWVGQDDDPAGWFGLESSEFALSRAQAA